MFSVHGDSKVQILDADAEAINMESTATTPDDLQDGTSKHRGLSFKNSGSSYLMHYVTLSEVGTSKVDQSP